MEGSGTTEKETVEVAPDPTIVVKAVPKVDVPEPSSGRVQFADLQRDKLVPAVGFETEPMLGKRRIPNSSF